MHLLCTVTILSFGFRLVTWIKYCYLAFSWVDFVPHRGIQRTLHRGHCATVAEHRGLPGEEILSYTSTFKSLYATTKCDHTVAKDPLHSFGIFLPLGISEQAGEIKVLVKDKEYLAVRVPWPAAKTDLNLLTNKCLVGDGVEKNKDYQRMVEIFSASCPISGLRKGKSCPGAEFMPFPANSDFQPWLLEWEGMEQAFLFVTLCSDLNFSAFSIRNSVVGAAQRQHCRPRRTAIFDSLFGQCRDSPSADYRFSDICDMLVGQDRAFDTWRHSAWAGESVYRR